MEIRCCGSTLLFKWLVLFGIFCFAVPAGSIAGEPDACKSLDGEKRGLAEKLLSKLHPYDCCDATFKECLEDQAPCPLVTRLASRLCKLVSAGKGERHIERWLYKRARSMMGTSKKAGIDLDGVPFAGEKNSPVELVEYACPRCPFCSRMTPPLYEEIVKGRLKGKARLFLKTFPLKSHEHSKEAGLAFMAAQKMGKFWKYVLLSYRRFDRFCPKKLSAWAEELGMDPARFKEAMDDPSTVKLLVEYKKEGIVNKVDATPTFFINRRKYVGDLELEELVDVLEEEYERATTGQ